MDAKAMIAAARDAHDRQVAEVIQLRKTRCGAPPKEQRGLNKEISRRMPCIELLFSLSQAEVSVDAETGIDGLFVAGSEG